MFFGDSKGFLGHLRDFLDFQGSLGFSLNSQGSSDFFSRFLGWCTRFLLVIHPSKNAVPFSNVVKGVVSKNFPGAGPGPHLSSPFTRSLATET